MRETRADTSQALIYALALHTLLFALMYWGLWWTRSNAPVSPAGPVIEAELIDPEALSAAMKRILRHRPEPVPPQAAEFEALERIDEDTAPLPQPLPEPSPQDSPVPQQMQAQERIPEPDTLEQVAVSALQLLEHSLEKIRRERHRQEQIDLTEQERQQQAEHRQRLSQMELDRQQQLADIRQRRATASRDARLAEEKLRQLADRRSSSAAEAAAQADARASASPLPGNEGVDDDLTAQYVRALTVAIRDNWTRPETVPLDLICKLTIRQLPGGEVVDVEVAASCPYDDLGRRSVEAAVLKAQPLPYAGFERVFNRTLILKFKAQDL